MVFTKALRKLGSVVPSGNSIRSGFRHNRLVRLPTLKKITPDPPALKVDRIFQNIAHYRRTVCSAVSVFTNICARSILNAFYLLLLVVTMHPEFFSWVSTGFGLLTAKHFGIHPKPNVGIKVPYGAAMQRYPSNLWYPNILSAVHLKIAKPSTENSTPHNLEVDAESLRIVRCTNC